MNEVTSPVVPIIDIPSWFDSHQALVEARHTRLQQAPSQSEWGVQLDKEVDLKYVENWSFFVDADINKKVALWKGDITLLHGDGVVNAARPSLLGGGGIDRAIHEAAGPLLLEECKKFNGCKHGDAKVTRAYNMPCKYIIHTVGPNRDLHEEDESRKLLRTTYLSCLQCLIEYNMKTVALCSVSTGAYRFPIRDATHTALLLLESGLRTMQRMWIRLCSMFFLILIKTFMLN